MVFRCPTWPNPTLAAHKLCAATVTTGPLPSATTAATDNSKRPSGTELSKQLGGIGFCPAILAIYMSRRD